MVSQNIKKIINQKYISTYESSYKNSPENIIVMVDDFHRFSIPHQDLILKLDEHSELINLSFGLGKGYKNGIIPAFPLYIITIIGAASDTRNKLDSPISSHGLCYQMLIDLTFQNSTIKHDMIDSYINFLTYLSYYFFQKQKHEISNSEFNEFTEEYIKRFNIYDLSKYFNPLYKNGLIKKIALALLNLVMIMFIIFF